jgi:hypothetical protein
MFAGLQRSSLVLLHFLNTKRRDSKFKKLLHRSVKLNYFCRSLKNLERESKFKIGVNLENLRCVRLVREY